MTDNILAHLQKASLTKKEFNKFLYLPRKAFTDSAKKRFSKFDTNLDFTHPDFKKRIEINKKLASLISINHFINYPGIKILELGASFGAISSLSVIIHLLENGYQGKISLTLLDISLEPLKRTKAIDFNLKGLMKHLKAIDHLEKVTQITKNSQIIKDSFINPSLKVLGSRFDIVISAFTQHHLNLNNKIRACKIMESIIQARGLILLGDLTFNYGQYIKWLKKHSNEKNSKGEEIPYAIESFITFNKHLKMFSNSIKINAVQGDIYYCAAFKSSHPKSIPK